MIRIWSNLRSVDGFNFLCVRNFNQDPLENLFGMIRSIGVRNTQPTCASFKDAFKTILLNNYLSSHSPGANCEDDGSTSTGSLENLKRFVTEKKAPVINECYDTISTNNFEAATFQFQAVSADLLHLHAYISGYVAKKMLSVDCVDCKNQLIGKGCKNVKLIEAKEYRPDILSNPDTIFVRIFSNIVSVLDFFFTKVMFRKKIICSAKKQN